MVITRVESDLADHDPPWREAELQFNELANPMMQLDRDIPRMLEDPVFHVRVHDRVTCVISSADAEHYTGLGEHLTWQRNIFLFFRISNYTIWYIRNDKSSHLTIYTRDHSSSFNMIIFYDYVYTFHKNRITDKQIFSS